MTQPHNTETKDRGGLHGAYDSTREKAADVYDATVDKATHAFERSRDTAREAAKSALGGLESNPLAVLVGGLAFGAIAASLIPRSDREKELLAPLGKRIGAAAGAALSAAKDAGREELASLGLSRDQVKERAEGLKGGLGRALSSAGTAAVDAAKNATGSANKTDSNA